MPIRLRLLFCILPCILLASDDARAHSLSVAYAEYERTADEDRLSVDLAIRDLALTLPLDLDGDDAVTWGELRSARTEIETLVAGGVRASVARDECRLEPREFGIRRYESGAYASLVFDVACPGPALPTLHYSLFFEQDPLHRAIITFRGDSGTRTSIATSGYPVVDPGITGTATFEKFVLEGIHHILIGYDHIAFLVLLLLPVVLVRSGVAWQPADNGARTAVRAAWIVTAFTLAHSVTLALAALGLVRPASTWVEAAIAVSVLLAAINNIFPFVARRAWQFAALFGLIHGFGFAGALQELGLPQGERLLALLAFNLGVEAGQLAIVLVLLPVLYAIRTRGWYPKMVLPSVSALVGLIALWWLVERTLL